MEDPQPIELVQLAAKVFAIAHQCGNCISVDPSKVIPEKKRLIAAEIAKYERASRQG